MSATYDVFLLLPPTNLCFEAALLGSPLAEDKSFIMGNLALLPLHIIFIGTFFYSRQECEPSHHHYFYYCIFQAC